MPNRHGNARPTTWRSRKASYEPDDIVSGLAGLDIRRLDDGREFSIVKVFRSADEYAQALQAAGFGDVDVTTTGRFFVLGQGVWKGG